VTNTKKVTRWLAFMLAALALVATFAPAYAQQNTAQVDTAVAYIRSQQQPDGSFAGFGPGSTADAIFALSAANVNMAELKQGGASPADYLRSQAATVAADTGVSAKFLIATMLAGQSPTFQGTDLVVNVEQGYNAQTGQYGKDVTTHAYALIGLLAAGRTPKPEAIEALKKLQLPDGGWSFDGTAASGSDTNTTSIAVQALKAVGDTSDAIGKAISYYKAQQNSDAGFPYSQSSQFGNASDANSTALSIQALIAAGENPANWARDGKTPIQRLAAFQNQSGAFRFQDTQPDDNALATYQAVPALLGKTLPLQGIALALPDQASGSPDPAPSTTSAPQPSSVPAGGAPERLPSTGTTDWTPALALLSALLLLSGAAVTRRRA
jgi:LPXTG-motif cell wall-anchored protein